MAPEGPAFHYPIRNLLSPQKSQKYCCLLSCTGYGTDFSEIFRLADRAKSKKPDNPPLPPQRKGC